MPQLRSFAAWLPEHAALVKAMSVHIGGAFRSHAGLTEVQYRGVAKQLLLHALQLARSPPDEAAGITSALAATSAAAAGQGVVGSFAHQQQRRLRLTSFASDLRAAGMLDSLPADSLTALDLSPVDSIGVDGRQLSALIARLSCLQQLSLTGPGTISMPGSVFEGIAQLTGLTALDLGNAWWGVDEVLQQLLSQSLPLRQLRLGLLLPVLDMTALASLTELILDRISGYAQLRPGSKLPAQLQRISLPECKETSALLGLQQLQHVRLGVEFTDSAKLRGLAQLPALRHVSLEYWNVYNALPTASAWQHLPQLSELTLAYNDDPSAQSMAAILAGVAAATSLTRLSLEARACLADETDDDSEDFEMRVTEVAACASLAGLTCLRDLTISAESRLVPGDALALSALTGLTRLKLAFADSAVDDVAASALACSLTQLCSLDLQGCALGGLACLAPIARLSRLTQLLLKDVEGITRRGVMLLTNLKQLQQLSVTVNEEVTQDWVDQEFWAALRQR
jgi:hypothetical protein